MSTVGSYPVSNFSPTQYFLAYNPSSQTLERVLGSELVTAINGDAVYVRAVSTRAVAQTLDLEIGVILQTGGGTVAGDGGSGAFLVVATGEGDFAMNNGNELLALPRGSLAGSDLDGALVTDNGTVREIQDAITSRPVEFESFAAIMLEDLSGYDYAATTGFYGGWADTVAGPKGGAIYHRDGTTGTASTAYADNSGFYDANGDGFSVQTDRITPFMLGAAGDGVADDTDAINAAIDAAAAAAGGAQGAIVYFHTGTYLISSMITQPNRVALKGVNGRGTILKPRAGFSDAFMIEASNGTSSMFGATIEDMHIDARGFNMTGVVNSKAWQETCGLKRVVIQYDGTTKYGLHYTDGYGGAAYLPIRDVEIFSDSTASDAAGIQVDQISLVGGFILSVDGATIAGTSTNPIPNAVVIVNDTMTIKGLHIEYCDNGIDMRGSGSLSADTITGSVNAVVDLVTLSAGFTGRAVLQNMVPNGATGNILTDNKDGKHIDANEGMLSHYVSPECGFSAYVATDILNVTGVGTEYTIIFDTEVYDNRADYNNATGIFTARRAGKYDFKSSVKFNPTLSVTTCVIKLITSNRTYYLFRGDTDSIRDGSGACTITGSFDVDMDQSDTARITVTCSGLAGDTIDVLSDESFFQCHYIGR